MKTRLFKFLALFLALLFCSGLVACNSGDDPVDTDDGTTSTEETNDATEESTEHESELETEAPDPNAHLAIDVKWNFGMVASSSHGTKPDQLVENTARHSYTDVFTIAKAGTTVTFTDDNTNSGGDRFFASSNAYIFSWWKQENGEWVLDTKGANYEGGSSTSPIIVSATEDAVTYSYTTTYDNENLRLCFRSGQSKSFTPSKFPTVYAEYAGKEGTAVERLYYCDALEGITVGALGDSYFAGPSINFDEVWLNLLAEKYDMTMKIDAVSGATVADARKSRVPHCDPSRYNAMPTDADIILLEGGRNDFNLPVADSTLPSQYTQVPIGEKGSTDVTTYIGAWNVIIDAIQAKCPNAMIVLISPWNFPNSSNRPIQRETYVNAMKQVAEEQGIYFIDATNTSLVGVNVQDYNFRAKYCIKDTDVSHLNAKGMALVMPKFEKILAEYYTEFLSKK